MYLGFLGLLAGAALAVGTFWAVVGPIVFFAVADRWYIPFEERRAAAVFGAAYERYRAEVRRWIGRRSVTVPR
jgi:protein-S-isoprenylcysteine O-methyltransferase Ste14